MRIEQRRSFPVPFLIGVIADTHVHGENPGTSLAHVADLFTRFRVNLIVHAGDANAISVLKTLSVVAPVLAVHGNNDDGDVMDVAPSQIEFEVGGFKFGVLHGHGGGIPARAEAKTRFSNHQDCVIYGHSHIPMIERVDGTIYFNPGSAEQRRWRPHFGIGLITVTADRIDPELILWDRPVDLRSIKPDTTPGQN